MSTENKKIVILSDSHVGNGKDYSWFYQTSENNYPQYLTDMLNLLSKDSSIDELLILGDFFDLWVYPMDYVPWTPEQIISHWNDTIMDALRACVANIPNVYYQVGNHDMSVTATQVEQIKAGDKTVQWISIDDYNQQYKGVLHCEHGNAVDMFNAPVPSDSTPTEALNDKPLGYYMARMIASKTKASEFSAWDLMCDEITNSCNAYTPENGLEIGNQMVKTLMELLMTECNSGGANIDDDSVFVFADDSQNVSIADVKNSYQNILNLWHKESDPDWLLNCALAMFKPHRTGLNWWAQRLVDNGDAKLVIMGHVHHNEWYSEGLTGQYINDGCWCNATPDPAPRYAEVIISSSGQLNMSLMGWNKETENGQLIRSGILP